MSIHLSKVVDIKLTPQDVANAYWNMCCADQAKFWNHLGIISSHRLCLQTAYLAESKEFSPCGIEAIKTIASHFEDK